MENKIAVLSLATSMAQATGKTKKLCEDFLREFFKIATECLESGEVLKIKGLGTFKIVDVESRSAVNINTGDRQEIAAYKKVVFTPSKELASEINAPFQEFESVEMDDDMPDEFYYDGKDEDTPQEEIETSAALSNENKVSEERLEEGSQEEGEDDDITYEAYKELEEQDPDTAVKDSEVVDPTVPNPTVVDRVDIDSHHDREPHFVNEHSEEITLPVYDEEEPKSRFGIGFLVGALSTFAVCAVIFMLGCFFNWWPLNFGNEKDVAIEKSEVAPAEEVMEQPEEVLAEPVYDTVSTTRFLTTIAREHYGDFNFWPYIYLENQEILGHPDRITPGTKVVVPSLSKYGVDISNPADVAEAKRKAQEIYSRFK